MGTAADGSVQRGAFSPADIRRALLLYGVTDSAWLHGRTLADCVRQAIAGGTTFISCARST